LTDPQQDLRFRSFGFLDYISNRHSDLLFGSRMLVEYPVLFLHPDQHIVAQVGGSTISKSVGADPYVRHVRWLLYALEHRWRLTRLAGDAFVHHCPTTENATARHMVERMRRSTGDAYSWWCDGPGSVQAWFVSTGCAQSADKRWMIWACVQAASPDGIVLVASAGCLVHVPAGPLVSFEALAFGIRLFICCMCKYKFAVGPSVDIDGLMTVCGALPSPSVQLAG
jgi:hypothetical protein